ncbi:MAG: LysR family transcriptional regulator [Acidobacteriaceae bacterium]
MGNHSPVNIDRFLRMAVTVAEEGQIMRAAVRLRIAQPWVSRQIREAEEEVGVKLFKRIHSGVEATPSGEAFLDEARQAVLHSELSVARARAASSSVEAPVMGVEPRDRHSKTCGHYGQLRNQEEPPLSPERGCLCEWVA